MFDIEILEGAIAMKACLTGIQPFCLEFDIIRSSSPLRSISNDVEEEFLTLTDATKFYLEELAAYLTFRSVLIA